MARGILDSLMSATYFNASALRLLRQLVIISFWKISLSKVDSKEFMFFAPRWLGEQILTSKCRWRRALVWGVDILQYIPSQPGWWPLSNWSTSSASSSWIFYGTLPRSQVGIPWYSSSASSLSIVSNILTTNMIIATTDTECELNRLFWRALRGHDLPCTAQCEFFPHWLVKKQ